MAVEGETQTETTTDTVEEPVIVVEEEATTEETVEEPKVEEPKVEETDEQKAERERVEALTSDAPEAYGDFTLPEGFELQPDVTEKLKSFGKLANLSQAATQEIVNLGADLVKSVQAAEAEQLQQLAEGWVTAAKADPAIGNGSEEKYQAALADAAKFRDSFGTPELVALLNESKLGDHPEVIRAFAKAGRAIKPANFVQPGKPGSRDERPGAGFYTKSNMK